MTPREMQPSDSHRCPECGADLPCPGAECAHCLLDLGLSTRATRLGGGTQPASGPAPACGVFAGYELLDEIARGGMGVVYRARQRNLGRTVALKLILGGLHATREFVHRFRSEAAAAAALQHPNIVAIHEVGVHEGNHFFSMDYVHGQNLAQLVDNRPLPAEKAARYLRTIAEAIHYAHEQGILHRDLKPSNVLVDAATDQPRVTDFGLAKRLDGESSLTLTGQVLGSPHFMPPEQADARRGKVGRASDVYGLGGILYFLLTARPPFQGDTLETTLGQVLNAEPVSPRLLNPSVPRDLETICLKCLEKEPVRRYPTARALAEDLDRLLKGEPTLARPTTRVEQAWRWCRRRPAIAGLLAAAIILLLTISIGSPIAMFRIERALHVAKANLYGADLNMVQTALEEADLVLARELLDRYRPGPGETDARGFEWRYLWDLCQGDEEYVLDPPITWPRRVVFSHDGRLLAAGNKEISGVWNVSTRALVEELPQGELPKGDRPVAFAPDRPGLVTAGSNGFKIWNTQNWREQLIGPCDAEAAAKFSPDGRWLVVYGDGLQVWDAHDWSLVSSNAFATNNFYTTSTLAISRDGGLVSCGEGLPYATAAELHVFRLPSLDRVPWSDVLPNGVSATVFHPEQDVFITGNWSGDIQLWDYNSGRELPSIMKQSARIFAMAINPANPNELATTGGDRSVRLWSLESQKEIKRMHGAREEIEELAYSPPDGRMIATGGHGNPITLWNVAQPKADTITIDTEQRNFVLGFSVDGRQVLTIDARGRLMYRDRNTFALLDTICLLDLKPAINQPPYLSLHAMAMAASEDITKFALGTAEGTVEIWDLTARTNVVLRAHSAAVRELAFSPDNHDLVSVGDDEAVHLWDLSTLTRIASARLEAMTDKTWPVCVRFSPSENIIAVGTSTQLSIFGSKDLQLLERVRELNLFVSLRFSPDGRHLAAGLQGPTIIVWDTRDWTRHSLRGHQMIPFDIAFSPDGHRMVTGSDRLVIWDTDTWQPLARYTLPIMTIDRVTFSPDGNDLIVSDAEAIRIWRAPSIEDIKERETRLGRWH